MGHMNTGLDDKLREILFPDQQSIEEEWGNGGDAVALLRTNESIAKIHQAFADAGYVNTKAVGFEGFTVKNLMTGQEWYDRFEKAFPGDGLMQPYIDIREQVLWAAKRASGLELLK